MLIGIIIIWISHFIGWILTPILLISDFSWPQQIVDNIETIGQLIWTIGNFIPIGYFFFLIFIITLLETSIFLLKFYLFFIKLLKA